MHSGPELLKTSDEKWQPGCHGIGPTGANPVDPTWCTPCPSHPHVRTTDNHPNRPRSLWVLHSLELTWKWKITPFGRPSSSTNRRFSTSVLVPGRVLGVVSDHSTFCPPHGPISDSSFSFSSSWLKAPENTNNTCLPLQGIITHALPLTWPAPWMARQ